MTSKFKKRLGRLSKGSGKPASPQVQERVVETTPAEVPSQVKKMKSHAHNLPRSWEGHSFVESLAEATSRQE